MRLLEGIRNKAARGEFRCTLPVGFVWGERDGEVRLHPDEEVVRAIRNVFERFAELGSMRRVWLWFRDEGLQFPARLRRGNDVRWIPPAYSSIVQVLRNPVYAGAYAFGKTRQERYLDDNGRMQKRLRRLPRTEWRVLLPGHHQGYIDWETFEANRGCRRRRFRRGHRRRPAPAPREHSAEPSTTGSTNWPSRTVTWPASIGGLRIAGRKPALTALPHPQNSIRSSCGSFGGAAPLTHCLVMQHPAGTCGG